MPTQTRRARVLAVDDQTSFLAVLRDLVSATRELEAVAEADSGERAIEAARDTEPDMILMDVWMPGIGGIAAAREIKASRPSTLVVLISTTHPDELPAPTRRHARRRGRLEARTRSTAARRHLATIPRPARAGTRLASHPNGDNHPSRQLFREAIGQHPRICVLPDPRGCQNRPHFSPARHLARRQRRCQIGLRI